MAKQKSKTKSSKSGSATGAAAKSKIKQVRHEVVHEEIAVAERAIEENYVELAKLLYEAYHQDHYVKWGYDDFKDYCDAELSTNYRKAMYLIDIWDKIKRLKLSPARVAKIGWTKMKDIASVIDEKNAKEWLDKAGKMSTREVTDAVKTVRKDSSGSPEVPTTTTLKIVMGETEAAVVLEAIEEAKALTESDSTALALEMIASDWMEEKGGLPTKTPIESHVAYLEKAYGVKITVKKGKKKSKAKADADKVEKAAEKKAADRKADDKDIEPTDDTTDEGEADINDLLGL